MDSKNFDGALGRCVKVFGETGSVGHKAGSGRPLNRIHSIKVSELGKFWRMMKELLFVIYRNRLQLCAPVMQFRHKDLLP